MATSLTSNSLLFLFSLILSSSSAHFLLNYPTSLGFDSNQEDASPCGGFTPSFSSVANYHVGGDAIALTTLHPQSDFLYRATIDQNAAGNWSALSPVVQEYGLGSFCEPFLAVPDSWVNSVGVIQVIQNAEDGVHYQCAAVKFVAGASGSVPSACQNSSGNSAAFVSDSTLLPASVPVATGTAGTVANTGSVTTSTPAASSTKSSGAVKQMSLEFTLAWCASFAVVYVILA